MKPVRIAVIGTQGCALSHHLALNALEAEGYYEVVATCDPALRDRPLPREIKPGLPQFLDYREMLDAVVGMADCVAVPTPIALHATMHREVLERGFSCYLEKPPTLNPAELEQMIDRDATAEKKTFVGFSHIFQPEFQRLKRQLVGGTFGRLLSTSFLGLWPRTRKYFDRNAWAGKLLWEDRLLLDSCLGNGMSHYVHTGLFWSGTGGLWQWGSPETVRAQLFRANEIEGPDGVFLEGKTTLGTSFRLVLSHCSSVSQTRETLQCEKARITVHYGYPTTIRIDWADGRNEVRCLPAANAYGENYRWFYHYLNGRHERPCTELSDCRGMVHLNGLAYVSSGAITPLLPDDLVPAIHQESPALFVAAMETVAERFLGSGFPLSPPFDRAPAPRLVREADLAKLTPVIRRLAARIPTPAPVGHFPG